MSDLLNDSDLLRYSRHVLLDQIDLEVQLQLKKARVMIVGLGGLGCPAALYLAASGVGALSLVDADHVELSNLQRQIAHGEQDVGQSKVGSLAQQIERINSTVQVTTHVQAANQEWLTTELEQVDLLLDCTDNAPVRYQMNQACLKTTTPWVSAAAVAFSGQLTLFDPGTEGSPCYACLYPPERMPATDSCSESGVLSPLVGMVGAWQAATAIKYLVGLPVPVGELLTLDLMANQMRSWRMFVAANCSVCGG